jgi:glycosyltransferase involved in cell wall biosynthesis
MNKNIKILHIIDSLGLGGAQTVVKGIFENQENNKDIFLFALRKKKITTKIKHNNIIIYFSFKKYSLKPLFELINLIKKENIEILHCHLFRSQIFGFLLKFFWFKNIKLIFHEHGKIFQNNFLYNIFLKISKNYVDKFIAVSQITKKRLILKINIKEDKIYVLNNFIDLNKFNKNNIKWDINEEKRKLGIVDNEFTIGFVGRLVKLKGCEYLIRALPYLNFPYKVIIAGDGPERKKLEDLVKKIGVSDKVIFLGYVENIIFVYSLLDVLILPSLREASPMIIYESEAINVPIIASDIPSIAGSDVKNILLFKKKDKLDLFKKLTFLKYNYKKNLENNIKKNDLVSYIIDLFKIYNIVTGDTQRYSLLKYSTNNIGDEIQSIAANQFLPSIDCFIDRDNLSKYNGYKTKLILNGWFSHKPENWPPSNSIDPLFVSFHISQVAYKNFLSEKSIKYFKLHEPIGCRDLNTVNILKLKGVDAYFSGCLTLTLKKRGFIKDNKILLVDVDENIANKIRKELNGQIEEINHYHNTGLLFLKNNLLKKYLYKIDFLKKIGKSKLIGNIITKIISPKTNDLNKIVRANEVLEKYEKAKVVFTSRIHVALPCLALGTPVFFIKKDLDDPRFSGLINFFNHYTNEEFLDDSCDFLKKINENPKEYLKFRQELTDRCQNFIKGV